MKLLSPIHISVAYTEADKILSIVYGEENVMFGEKKTISVARMLEIVIDTNVSMYDQEQKGHVNKDLFYLYMGIKLMAREYMQLKTLEEKGIEMVDLTLTQNQKEMLNMFNKHLTGGVPENDYLWSVASMLCFMAGRAFEQDVEEAKELIRTIKL